jgi:hypothetical protein
MSRLLALFVLLLGSMATGFLQPTRPTNRKVTHEGNGNAKSHMEIRSRIFMTNTTVPSGDDSQTNPLAGLKKGFDSFYSTSSYRTLLFCGALLSSPKLRDFIGIPGCIGIVAITWGIYTYDYRFNFLVDVVTPRRQVALRQLRDAKAAQLTSSPTDSEASIEELAAAYEEALREELSTRVIVPGLWVIEMDPTQDDRSAAPQFLGLDITEQHTLEPTKKS